MLLTAASTHSVWYNSEKNIFFFADTVHRIVDTVCRWNEESQKRFTEFHNSSHCNSSWSIWELVSRNFIQAFKNPSSDTSFYTNDDLYDWKHAM